MRLLVCVPSSRDWKGRFGASLNGLCDYLRSKGVGGQRLEAFQLYTQMGASCLPRARQAAFKKAVDEGFTHLLCIDDDMEFAPDILDTMGIAGKPVVAANCCRKTEEVIGTAIGEDGKPIDSHGKTGLEEVAWVGFGVVLIDVNVVREIPAPHFEVRWIEDKQDYLGEDMYFFNKCRQFGFEVWVDHDASNKIGHIGDYVYKFARSA